MQQRFRAVSFRGARATIQPLFRVLACAALASALASPALAENTIVRMEITYGANQGNIDVELYDDETPQTVDNFLRYAGRGYYTNFIHPDLIDTPFHGFFHYSQPGFAIRAGGYSYTEDVGFPYYLSIPQDPPIANESSPSRPNTRGSVAMFNPTDNPGNITSQWLINLAGNSALSINAVFGRVIAGMDVADAIGALETRNSPAVGHPQVPVVDYDPASGPVGPSNLVKVTRIPNVKSTGTIWGTLATFTAGVGMEFTSTGAFSIVNTELLLSSFTPPPGTSAYHMSGILFFEMAGTMDPAGEIVVLRHGALTGPNRYYAFGKTPDDPTDHWYDFTYDGVTGAEIVGNRIRLHFVDGQRGDGDLDPTNNRIAHIGAPTLISTPDTGKLSGCTIATRPSRAIHHGDWIVVSIFLAFVALRRRRMGRDQR